MLAVLISNPWGAEGAVLAVLIRNVCRRPSHPASATGLCAGSCPASAAALCAAPRARCARCLFGAFVKDSPQESPRTASQRKSQNSNVIDKSYLLEPLARVPPGELRKRTRNEVLEQ